MKTPTHRGRRRRGMAADSPYLELVFCVQPPLTSPCLTRGNPSEKKERLPRPEVPSTGGISTHKHTHPCFRGNGGPMPEYSGYYTHTHEPMRSRSHRRVGSMQRRVALHTPRPSLDSTEFRGGRGFCFAPRRKTTLSDSERSEEESKGSMKSEDQRSRESQKNELQN